MPDIYLDDERAEFNYLFLNVADVSVLSYGSLAVYSIHIIVSFVLLAGANLVSKYSMSCYVANDQWWRQ